MKSVRMKSFSLAIAGVGFAIAATAANADESSLAKTGAALNDPLSNVWALFTEFDSTWSEGDFSGGDHRSGGAMVVHQNIEPFTTFLANLVDKALLE